MVAADTVSFGVFEFRMRSLELYKLGVRLKLQDQPSRVLALLLTNPGEVITRERLQKELWPDDSYGEFDSGLNTAISKLRAALGDSAANPIFIERIPKLGYRFIAPVRQQTPGAAQQSPLPSPPPSIPPPPPPKPRRFPARYAAVAIAGIAILAGAAALVRAVTRREPPPPTTRFTIELPAGQTIARYRRVVGISRDGSTIGYLAHNRGTSQVFVRTLDEDTFHAVPGTESATDFSLSPDGREVLFLTGTKWTRTDLSGKNASRVADVTVSFGSSAIWGNDGSIYFGDTEVRGVRDPSFSASFIYRLDPSGGVQRLTAKPKEPLWYFPQQVLDRNRLLISANAGPKARHVSFIADKEDSVPVSIIQPAMGGYALNSGHLVYYWKETLLAAPLDLDNLKTLGPGIPVVNHVAENSWVGGQAAISDNGTLVYVPAPPRNTVLTWVDRTGVETPFNVPPAPYSVLSLSPSGTRVLIHRTDAEQAGIWLHELTGTGKWTRLTSGTTPSVSGVWSPDEKYVVVTAGLQGEEFENLYLLRLDPLGEPRRIAPSSSGQFAQAWTAATGVVYTESEKPPTLIDMLRVDPLAQSKPTPFVTTPKHDSHASISPDGRWVVYSSDWQSRTELYVRPVDGAETQAQRIGAGSCPAWSPTGREIFYRANGGMWSLPVNGGHPSASPRRLFDLPGTCRIWNREYDVSSDGNRFLITKPISDPDEGRHVNVILNWTTELQRLVPRAPNYPNTR